MAENCNMICSARRLFAAMATATALVMFQCNVQELVVEASVGQDPEADEKNSSLLHFGDPTIFGSGCLSPLVHVSRNETGGQPVLVKAGFEDYTARTGERTTRARVACSMAWPIEVAAGYSVGFIATYEGVTSVPSNDPSALAKFKAEYFFSGQSGPQIEEDFTAVRDQNFTVSNSCGRIAMAWSPCGDGSVILRVESSITAVKGRDSDEDVNIQISSASFIPLVRPCVLG